MSATETKELQVKLLKNHLGLKKDAIEKMDEDTAKDLISKGVAEEVRVTPETIDAAVAEVSKSFENKLVEFGTKLTTDLEDRFAKGIKKLKATQPAGANVQVGEDGRLLDPTNGFRSLAEFSKCVRNVCVGAGEDERLTVLRKAAAGASEGVAADGGYAVPVQYATNIYNDILGQESLFNQCFKVPMNSSSIKLPALNYTQQGSFGIAANWEGEAATIPTSKQAYRQPSLTLNKLTALVPVTTELLEDGIAVEPIITQLAGEAMTFKLNDAIINGDGAGKPVGIVGHASTVTISKESGQATGTYNAQNALKMYSALYGNRSRSKWYMNQDVFPQLLQIQDAAGRFLYFAPGTFGDSPNGRLLGHEVVPLINCQSLSTKGDVILWDPMSYAIGYKATGPQMAISIHLYFATDQTAYRWTFRVDGRPWRDATLSAANGSAVYGGAVVLQSR